MKQTKWQRLATIGLCSSLVINAFSGATAVAENITIESSPTVASSAKEATSASSATPESTESSQETTETSREEVTQEIEKPEVVEKISDDKEKTVISDYLNKGAKTIPEINKISPKATYNFPKVNYQFGFVDEAGNLMNPAPFSILFDYARGDRTTVPVKWTVISANEKATDSADNLKNMVVPAVSLAQPAGGAIYSVPSNFRLTIPKYYSSISIYNSDGKINPKYPVPIVKQYDSGVINNWIDEFHALNLTKDEAGYYKMYDTSVDGHGYPLLMQRYVTPPGKISHNVYTYFSGPVYYHLINRKVTENFVDATGAKITPPTGFTQGQQTSITSNDFTYTSAKALPDTYKASNGKTYKFKGWYKGKTKPNTLTTTKAPSYAVTYDDNDDLNVVYEEIEAFDFPALTYQFGFVDESGKRVDASTIKLTYDNWHGEGLATNSADSNKPDYWKTVSLEKGKVAPTKNNLKEIAYPAQSLEILSDRGIQHSAANLTFTLPKYYEKISVYNKSGTFDVAYPFPNIQGNNYSEPFVEGENKLLSRIFELKNNGSQSFIFNRTTPAAPIDIQVPGYLRKIVHNPNWGAAAVATYHTIDKPVYYYLTNRKVTENFVDTNGTKIAPPTGFTQGKQTVINSDPYTFKQSGTLPDTYQADGKTYKFKGWYKGKVIPNTLTTTKAPSYAVTYDDNDDLNVVYEEIEAFDFPALTYQFGFVDESGKRVDASTIDLTYDNWHGELLSSVDGWKTTNIEKGQVALTKNNLKEIVYPSHSLEIMNGRSSQYSAANLTFKIPKYYENISVYNKNGTFDTAYPFPTIKVNTSTTPLSSRPQLFQLKKSNNQSFIFNQTTTAAPADVQVPYNLREIVYDPANSVDKGLYHMLDKPIYYYLTNRKVTENFVDTNGTKITPPTGFTQGNQIPMTSNTFKYTAAKALPATYTAGGKTYIFQGWYKGKTKPSTLTTSTTPTYNTTFDGNDDMTAMYKEEVPKASVALTRTTAETVTSGGNVTWRATITNTSQAPLTTATIKKSTAWTTGLAAPTAMIVTPAGGTAKTVPVTATTWTNGVSLGTDIPVGKSATVQFTTKATGTAGQVLRAGITTSGNYSGVSASATVRVKDNDQAIVTPTAEGFISVPTFNFGQVGVAGSTQQHSLKKAADYYGNGTRNPYLRIKKTQPNWSLTAQLSQPKSATDSLPTATRLLLGAAPVSSFSNYNQPTELKNAVGTTSAISLNANNTATRIIANQQFTGSNIYQLDFTFNNVKLEVPANQGVKGQQYQAAITWNLVTGP